MRRYVNIPKCGMQSFKLRVFFWSLVSLYTLENQSNWNSDLIRLIVLVCFVLIEINELTFSTLHVAQGVFSGIFLLLSVRDTWGEFPSHNLPEGSVPRIKDCCPDLFPAIQNRLLCRRGSSRPRHRVRVSLNSSTRANLDSGALEDSIHLTTERKPYLKSREGPCIPQPLLFSHCVLSRSPSRDSHVVNQERFRICQIHLLKIHIPLLERQFYFSQP